MAPSKLSFFSVSGYTKKKSGAVARALHHEVKRNSLPAVFENVSSTTSERKYMSKKTSFKRIALGVVVALGFGIMSSTPSAAVVSDEVLTLSGTTGLTAVVNESTTAVTATLTFFASANTDSRTLTATAVNSTGSGSATVVFRSTGNDSSNVTVGTNNFKSDQVDTALAVTANAGVKATYSVLAYGFTEVGTYTITVFTRAYTAKTSYADNVGVKAYETQKYASYTVTVTAASTEPTTIKTHTVAAGSEATALYYKNRYAATSDSAVVVDKGTNQSYTAVALIVGNLYASNGETRTGTAKANICATACTVNVTTNLGVIDNANGAGNSPSTFETMTIGNTTNASIKNETITVYSNGSTGVATISYYLASNNILLGTSTVTFVGTPASVSQMYSNDTITNKAAATGTLNAIVKDAAGTTMKSGTVYLYSSDTKVAGSTSATAIYQTCTIGATGVAACTFTVSDTGTATLTLRDSTTVALSTWVSAGWDVTVTGDVAKSVTATFDKTTYAPGERAILTLTVKDARDVGLATGSTFAFTAVNTANSLTYVTTTGERGTASSLTTPTVFTSYMDTGVETRVITMPTVAGDVKIDHKFAKFWVLTGGSGAADEVVSATAKVVDPAQAAIKVSADAATSAAEAATDAAAEAIDAANAATDAANLAAEAADAATVAAEEARDAADAATAAVEELATQVATLMAALKAQITTLANTVAKIAKKVKA
jgi:hypothetical protein